MVATFTAEQYQRRPTRVRINLDGGGRIDLPVPAVLPRQGVADAVDPIDGAPREIQEAILNRLADTCKRHSREEMRSALDEHSESAVQKTLWLMRKLGKLSHAKDSYGNGFGLPEWK